MTRIRGHPSILIEPNIIIGILHCTEFYQNGGSPPVCGEHVHTGRRHD